MPAPGAAAQARAPWPRARTKLVCTLGPATETRLDELLAGGTSIIRLNLAHGDTAALGHRVGAIRAASARTGREVAVLADLPGPKVRLGPLEGGLAELVSGDTVVLGAAGSSAGGAEGRRLETNHPGLAGDLRAGDHVHLADGAVELVVQTITGDEVTTLVERGGTVRSRAGVSVPAERLSLPVIGDRDRELARRAVEAGVDLVGQSFVRGPADVEALRAVLGPGGPGIIAKIETRPAVDAFDEILRVADGVMVARGDLGLALPFEAVPLVQKRLVARAVARHRPVIVATQMLESMHEAPRPTRAEASDVANAVLDGADAVMLSGETAIGAYPLLAVDAALRICAAAEGAGPIGPHVDGGTPVVHDDDVDTALAVAAVALATTADVLLCAAPPEHVRALAAHRPPVPVVPVVPDTGTARSLLVARGVLPVVPSDPGVTRGRGVQASELLADPAIRAVLPPAGRVVIVAIDTDGGAGRVELVTLDGWEDGRRADGGGAGAA